MSELNSYSSTTEAPTFYEVLQATKDSGLVGEEDTVLTLILSMVRGNLVVMTGPSRAGKDEAVDGAESVFQSDDLVYRWPVDDSETAAYYKRHEINQYPIHRFPDLARLQEHHEKILKAFGEGRDAERNRTDIMADQRGDDPVEDQILECPKTVIAFIASDNQNVNLDDYPELRNRALTLSVDASEGQTSRVNERKARERAGITENNIDPLRVAEIQQYHASIPVQEWTETPGNKILNPAALEIHAEEPIPEKFPEARQDFDRLLEFMETVTLHHYAERMVVNEGGSRKMYTTPVDIWEAMTILGNKMVMSALNLKREDRTILYLLRETKANLTKADIQQQLRAEGFNITDSDVRRSLESMRMKGYVRVHQDNPNSYSLSDFATVVQHDAGLDYDAIVDASSQRIYDIAPDEDADRYVERFCKGDGLLTEHPFNGRSIDITETDDLVEMMEDGMEDVGEVLDGEEVEETEEGEAQRTLLQ